MSQVLDDTGQRRYEAGVLDGLFPEGVVTVWGDPSEPSEPLFPEEEALVARAISKRKLEFAKGRECARRALASFGRGKAILLSGSHREPLWPPETTPRWESMPNPPTRSSPPSRARCAARATRALVGWSRSRTRSYRVSFFR